jgi:hypothetical protein
MGVGLRNAGQWALRIGVCQILGTFAGVVGASALSLVLWPAHASGGDWLSGISVTVLVGLLYEIPFYCVVLLLFRVARASILKRPAIWCLAVPSSLFLAALIPFPPNKVEGIIWFALIPLCALFAGILFYGWLRISPMEN